MQSVGIAGLVAGLESLLPSNIHSSLPRGYPHVSRYRHLHPRTVSPRLSLLIAAENMTKATKRGNVFLIYRQCRGLSTNAQTFFGASRVTGVNQNMKISN